MLALVPHHCTEPNTCMGVDDDIVGPPLIRIGLCLLIALMVINIRSVFFFYDLIYEFVIIKVIEEAHLNGFRVLKTN